MAFFANSARDTQYDTRIGRRKSRCSTWRHRSRKQTRKKLKAEIDALEDQAEDADAQSLQRLSLPGRRKQLDAASDWKPIQHVQHELAFRHDAEPCEPNGAILASGKNPQRETFVIEGEVAVDKLTGIRLEALPHEQLPRGGPGRDIYGNAIVSDIKVEIAAIGGEWQPVRFKRVLSDDGRTQDERTRKLWIIDASREDKRLARQLVLMTGGAGEAERKAEIADFDPAGF